ncbi:MAG: family 20 glycosylhydrolase [Kiritimatiellae bacterium]|nr:family 20 glycosylhydrolase [Kiritimatiellia bacterium]
MDMRSFLAAGAALAASVAAAAAPRSVLDELMPVPAKVELLPGSAVANAATAKVEAVRGEVPGAPAATADEAYVLEVSACGARITSPTPRGERWARVTLDQIARLAEGGSVPCCRIADWPRLKWRGFMLDSVRNYRPVGGVKDIVDAMSRYKLNLFHWHLTENYAWRLESKKYPELQSERAFLHRHKGMYYTQDEFREVVDYAYARGVCVMPEFDFPGHSLAFRRAFGFETMSDPRVAEVAEGLFDELCGLAPKEKMPFVHMGTDEVWKRDVEAATKEALERMAAAVAKHGRAVVSWVPGEDYACVGQHVNMLWTDKVSPDTHPGPYFDAIGMYIEDFDPFELLSVAVYHKAARWHDAGDKNFGAIFCAWHDGFVGLPYENLLRNQPVFPSCVLFGNNYWRGRADDLAKFRKRLPLGGDPLLAEAADVERRTVAQRDRALRDLRHPFHFLRQTDMRWRISLADGTLVADGVAQATISPERIMDQSGKFLSQSNGTVFAETWIKSPKDQSVGAWIGFTNISRDHGLVYSAPLPGVGEWNRFGACVELNGEKVAPPKWKRPGLGLGKVIADWTPAWTLYEADEEPFTDQEYFMRPPTPIRLRKGWNHVRLTIPSPASEGPKNFLRGKNRHRWVGTFIPVSGSTDHPREVPGLEYSSAPRFCADASVLSPRIKRLQDRALDHDVFPRAVKVAYAAADEKLPEPVRIGKRLCEYMSAQPVAIREDEELVGWLPFDGSVESDLYRRTGHVAFRSLCMPQYYLKPKDRLATFEWLHSCGDFGKIVRVGFSGLRREVAASREKWAGDGERLDYLKGLDLAIDGVEARAKNCAAECRRLAEAEKDAARRAALLEMAERLRPCADESCEDVRRGRAGRLLLL